MRMTERARSVGVSDPSSIPTIQCGDNQCHDRRSYGCENGGYLNQI
jgi:hypothetical protein